MLLQWSVIAAKQHEGIGEGLSIVQLTCKFAVEKVAKWIYSELKSTHVHRRQLDKISTVAVT